MGPKSRRCSSSGQPPQNMGLQEATENAIAIMTQIRHLATDKRPNPARSDEEAQECRMSCRLALSVRAASISMEIFVAECQKSIGAGLKTCWHVSVSEVTVSSSESRHKIGRPGARAAAGTRIDLEETDMEPDLEVVQIRPGESFAAWSHGYPYRTVRWHFHPEYELHQVVATKRPLFRWRLHRRV